MRATLLTMLVALVALVSAVAATSALSPTTYRAQANAICARFHRLEHAQDGQTSTLPLRKFYEQILGRAIALNQQRYAAVDTLDPPASLAAAHSRVLVAIARETALFQEVLARVRTAADPNRVMSASLRPELTLVAQEVRVWVAIGAKTCTNP